MSELRTFFTAGPAALYPTFAQHMMQALADQIGSISHRSAAYKKIHQHTDEQLRILLGIPTSSAILFLGSASEVWERILLNLVEFESYHCVNGSFSKKFYQYAQALQKTANQTEKPVGQGFFAADVEVPAYAEVICLTQNETSSGVQMREVDIHKVKRSHAQKLVAVDMVSSAPIPALDMNLVDTAFFSVQKAFGLPAGLGVWIANEACLNKAYELRDQKKISIGAHHDLPTLWEQSKSYQTPATPNVLLIYLLGKVAEDMNRLGREKIQEDSRIKAKMLYDYMEYSHLFQPAVAEEAHRSSTVVVADTRIDSAVVVDRLRQKNLIIGPGYGAKKDSQIRIANFPATSIEQIEQLLTALQELEP